MNTKTRLSVLYELIRALHRHDSWCGETHIQKAAFFLQHVKGEKLFPFVLYKFGPFSFDLRDDLELMRVYGFIEQKFEATGYGPRLFPSDNEKLKFDAAELAAEFEPLIEFVSTELGTAGVAELERLATALFFTRDEGVADPGECVERIRAVKPHIGAVEAREAISRVAEILARAPQAA